MNTSVTLTAEEFKDLHNAIWSMEREAQGLGGRGQSILGLVEDMRQALAGAYDQEDQEWQRKNNHYTLIQEQSNFSSVWSMYEISDFSQVPYPDARRLIYYNHWGPEHITVDLVAGDWHALWSAADSAIRRSGDQHHIYIEKIEPSEGDPTTLTLQTGS